MVLLVLSRARQRREAQHDDKVEMLHADKDNDFMTIRQRITKEKSYPLQWTVPAVD
jgi:hypothetical protein